MTPLKARQERFCRRFAEFGCATTAARAAGHAPKWAKTAGYRLLRHPTARGDLRRSRRGGVDLGGF